MRTIIEGVYENGQILLARQPKVSVRTKVTVIFEEISDSDTVHKKRPFGISKGAFEISPDFDDPLDDLKEYM